MFKGDFVKNLPKIYGTYTGGFLVFIILMAIAEQAGVSAKNIGVMFVAFTVCIYALIGYSGLRAPTNVGGLGEQLKLAGQ